MQRSRGTASSTCSDWLGSPCGSPAASECDSLVIATSKLGQIYEDDLRRSLRQRLAISLLDVQIPGSTCIKLLGQSEHQH